MEPLAMELFGPSNTDKGSRKVDFSNIRQVIDDKIAALHRLDNEQVDAVTVNSALRSTHEDPTDLRFPGGRLGPRVVQLSRTANLGPLMLSDGDTEVEAHCHLGSILATVCVFEGRWQYEATIGTSGIQQIGWAPHSCPFTNEEGVGDSRDSYAFDGNRVTKWHDGSFPYGQAWVTGDVIGCCTDLNDGNITYYRNGRTMGVAFTKVRKGVGYFPAISLSYGERCSFNFGRRPFEYPIESYSPLQEPPLKIFLSSSTSSAPATGPNKLSLAPCDTKRSISYITESLVTLLRMEKRRLQSPNDAACSREDILIAASILLEYLAPLSLHEYYVVDIWYPLLVSCMEDGGLVEIVIQWMQLLLERFEWESCMRFLFKYLAFKCRTTGPLQALQPITNTTSRPANSVRSFPALALVLELLRMPYVLDFALSLEEFNTHLEHIIAFKQPSKADLAVLLPFVWWQGGEGEPQCSESRFLHDMESLNACIREYEDLIYEIFVVLHRVGTTNNVPVQESNAGAGSSASPTPAHFFRNWMMNYIVVKNKGANRNVVPPGLSPSSVLANIYFALLRLLFAGDMVASVSSTQEAFQSLFCKGTEPISEFARLGGTLGHLQKTTLLNQPTEGKESTPLEVVMMDTAVMVYHLGVSSIFKASSQQQSAVRQSLARLSEAKKAARGSEFTTATNHPPDLVANVVQELRLMNYSHAILVGDKQPQMSSTATAVERRQLLKQETMYKMTVFLAELITTLSRRGPAFAYTPEYYMESMVDGFHSLRRAVPPLPLTTPLSPYSGGLTVILSTFIRCFNDPRIVNPDVRDLLLQSIGVLMQYNEYVTFIEDLPSDSHSSGEHDYARGRGAPTAKSESERSEGSMQAMLVRGLLHAFDKKFWITVSSILLRIWKGVGIRPNTATDPPPAAFCGIFKHIVSQDTQLLNTFLNNLFNTLNTTISEFSVLKLDVTKMSPNDIRKANFLMELSINLLKILEVVSLDVASAFIQDELNMARLVELLLLILNRSTIGPDATRLDSVLVQEQQVSRAWILAPLVGIVLNLHSHSPPSGSLALMEALLDDASFKMEAFNYLLEYSWSPPQVLCTDTWTKNLKEFVGKLKAQEASRVTKQQPRIGGGEGGDDDDDDGGIDGFARLDPSVEQCSICYGAPIDTLFEPCHHASCHRCISRHLLNNTRCFFCNADVVSTHPSAPSPVRPVAVVVDQKQ